MADPDPHTKSLEPAVKCKCEYCHFIRSTLIPEMVHGRYFCESGSREFVELDSVDVEHFDRKCSRKNTLHRATARVKFSGVTCSFSLIIKLLKHVDAVPFEPAFLNEEMFYSKMTLNYGTNSIPKCYVSDLGRFDGQALIVLEDLAARGYTQVDDKLDEDHLKLCMKALAGFHGKGLKLKAHRFPVFREFYAKLSVPMDWLHFHTSSQADSPRTDIIVGSWLDDPGCLDTSLYSVLPVGSVLSQKIRNKRDVTTQLEPNDFWIICHGNFTRNNLLFRYENGRPSDVKVIDWSAMRYCSPSIDFGHILLENLPDDDNLPMVEAFCRNILEIYLDAVKDEYPEVDRELFKQDIIAKLPFVYGRIENRMLKEAGMMLRALDQLGSFG